MLNHIGKYELKGLLGTGASGTVYLGVDTFSSVEVAVKVIDQAVFDDPEFGAALRRQFLVEASLAGKLNHPHIVSILDAVVTSEDGHIAMEYVPGGNLSKHINTDKLMSVEDAIQVGFKCSGALDYAFRQGIIHRDIKPANIMVVKGTQIKIADFGAAYLQTADRTQAANIGTPAYMSPEQISDQPLTHHSDMYCLGVVLYELLTGRRPFVAKSMDDLIEKIMLEEPAPPSRLRPSLPRALDDIVLSALQKAPGDRYASWTDFALELAKIGRLSVYQQTIPDSEKYASMRGVEVLGKLNDAEIWELVHAGRWSRLAARSLILREDEPGQTLFFLAKGELKVMKHGHLLNIIGAGECFGDMSYIRGGDIPRQASVESLTDVVIAEFDGAELEKMSDRCQHQLARAMLRNLVDRLALADIRVSQVVR